MLLSQAQTVRNFSRLELCPTENWCDTTRNPANLCNIFQGFRQSTWIFRGMESGLVTLPIPGRTCGEARPTGVSGFNLLLLQCRLLRQIGHPMESELLFLVKHQADPGRSIRFRRKAAAPSS